VRSRLRARSGTRTRWPTPVLFTRRWTSRAAPTRSPSNQALALRPWSDAVHARASWLAEEGNEEIAAKFLAGAFEGWAYCCDNPDECVQHTVDAGSTLGLGHQRWTMNEINALIWPAADGIGSVREDTWAKTVEIMLDSGLIKEAPGDDARRSDLTEAAWALLGDSVDLTGEGYAKGMVEVTAGGE
jgi:NitT/TauT family transport system substrate-binding protein